jgi:hypothetical protein
MRQDVKKFTAFSAKHICLHNGLSNARNYIPLCLAQGIYSTASLGDMPSPWSAQVVEVPKAKLLNSRMLSVSPGKGKYKISNTMDQVNQNFSGKEYSLQQFNPNSN